MTAGTEGTFWRRRVVAPIVAQLTLGVSPERLASTLAVGTTVALFPLLGATTALALVAGLVFRMNQIVLHSVNQLLGPVQLLLILVYLRAGEWLWRAPVDRFSIPEMVRAYHEHGATDFLRRFGLAGVHAVSAWAVSAPFVAGLVYLAVRAPIRRLAATRPSAIVAT